MLKSVLLTVVIGVASHLQVVWLVRSRLNRTSWRTSGVWRIREPGHACSKL